MVGHGQWSGDGATVTLGVMHTGDGAAGPFGCFGAVAAALLEEARERLPEVDWVVTRADGEDLVVVHAAAADPDVVEGGRLRPLSAADLVVPIELPDGAPFGALCGLVQRLAGGSDVAAPLARRLAGVLTTVLAAESTAQDHARRAQAAVERAQRAEEEALTDPLTGVANRRAWDLVLAAEERRWQRYGGEASIVAVDLDDFKGVNAREGHLGGDLLLRMAASALRGVSRESDTVARVGGDEFALLALGCDESALGALVGRVREALQAGGVAASVGAACRRPPATLVAAWGEADEAMYREKSARRAPRPAPAGEPSPG